MVISRDNISKLHSYSTSFNPKFEINSNRKFSQICETKSRSTFYFTSSYRSFIMFFRYIFPYNYKCDVLLHYNVIINVSENCIHNLYYLPLWLLQENVKLKCLIFLLSDSSRAEFYRKNNFTFQSILAPKIWAFKVGKFSEFDKFQGEKIKVKKN